jgi:hypothetical protein
MIVQPQVAGEEDDCGLHCGQASGEPEAVSIEGVFFSKALATASDRVPDIGERQVRSYVLSFALPLALPKFGATLDIDWSRGSWDRAT